jgi:hypothetical protein
MASNEGPSQETVSVEDKGPTELQQIKSVVDKRFDDDKTLRNEWADFQNYYTNDYWDDEELEKYDSEVTANYFFSNIQTLLPLMTDSRPIWMVHSRFSFLQNVLNHWQEALKYAWMVHDLDMKVPMAYLDALVSETGFFKTTWDPDKGTDRAPGDMRIEVVNPKFMVFAAGYDELDECPWVGEKRRQPLSWIQKHYPRLREKVLPDSNTDTGDSDAASNPDELGSFASKNRWTTVYDLWLEDDGAEQELKKEAAGQGTSPSDGEKGVGDKLKRGKHPNGRLVTFAANGKGGGPVLLSDVPSPYNHGKSPWVPVYDYRQTHQVWGHGECRQIRSLVLELNSQLQYIAHALRNYSRQNWEVDSNVQEPEKVKETFHEGGQFYTRKAQYGTEGATGMGIRPIQPAAPPEQFFKWLRALIDIIEEVSGVTELSKGIQEKRARQTAQEISTIIETSYTRVRQKVRNLEWSIKQLATRILEIMMQYYDGEREYSTTGEDQRVVFGKISNSQPFAREALKPNASKGASREERKEEQERSDQDLAALLELVPGDGDPVYIPFDIEIQTNSMLPLDKQSLANLSLRLQQQNVIDDEATLDTLNYPNRREIIKRKRAKEEREAKAKAGGGAPRPAPGRPLPNANPTDMADNIRQMTPAGGR